MGLCWNDWALFYCWASTERTARCRHLQLKSWKGLQWHMIIFHIGALITIVKSRRKRILSASKWNAEGHSETAQFDALETGDTQLSCRSYWNHNLHNCDTEIFYKWSKPGAVFQKYDWLSKLIFGTAAAFPDHGKYLKISKRETQVVINQEPVYPKNTWASNLHMSFHFSLMAFQWQW